MEADQELNIEEFVQELTKGNVSEQNLQFSHKILVPISFKFKIKYH